MDSVASFALVTSMIVGVVELVNRLFDRDWRAACIIASSAAVGALCGLYSIQGVDVATGITLGFSAAGAVTVATKTRPKQDAK